MNTAQKFRGAVAAVDTIGADGYERDVIIKALVESADYGDFAAEYKSVSKLPAVQVLHAAMSECQRKIDHLLAHARRTTHPRLRCYMESVKLVEERFRERPNHRLWIALNRHAQYCESILRDLRAGNYDDSYAALASDRLQEELVKDADDLVHQIGKLETDVDPDLRSDADLDDDLKEMHDKFIAAIEKQFKISVHHWEPVREGLIAFLDEENTESLLGQLRSYNDVLQKITGEHGYTLLRRGASTDIVYGNFPKPLSKWIFIHAPNEVESWLEPDALDKLSDELESEVAAFDKKLTKGVEKLPLGVATNTARVKDLSKQLGTGKKKWDRV